MRRSRRENLRLHGMGKGTGRIGCGALGRPGAVLPGVCRLIAAYGASWKGDSARLTHPIATPSLPRRGDAQMGTRGHGGGGGASVPAAPGVRRVPLGDGSACRPAPGSGIFLGGKGSWLCGLAASRFACCSSEGGCCGPEEKVSRPGGSVWRLRLRRCQSAAQTQSHVGAGQWERKSRRVSGHG